MLDITIISLAEITTIVSHLIINLEFNSLIKVEFSSIMMVYYLRHDIDKKLINASKFDRVHHFFCNFLSVLFSSEKELKIINEAICILEKKGIITVNGDKITIRREIQNIPLLPFFENEYVCNTLGTINNLSNQSFLEEVFCND